MSELQALKAHSKARELQEKRLAERRRNALVLILRHLLDAGYLDSYERLSHEANISLKQVDVADNISLLRILQEYEDAHEANYGTRVRLVRKSSAAAAGPPAEEGHGGALIGAVRPPLPRSVSAAAAAASSAAAAVAASPPHGVLSAAPPAPPGAAGNAARQGLDGPPISGAVLARQRRERGASSAEEQRRQEALDRRQRAMDSVKPPAEAGHQVIAGVVIGPGGVQGGALGSPDTHLAVAGCAVGRSAPVDVSDTECDSDRDVPHRPLLKPLPIHLRGDLADLSNAITRDIYVDNPNVRWESIAGLDTAKQLLVEAVVQPIKYPQLFTGLLAPWKGVLLYGPPGTGKTLLAKAVATECRTTFFNVQASTIISKWRGDSEKLVRVLFDLARHHAPSTIFLDEVDALMSARGGEGEHEASRRMKTELLIQMDGLAKSLAMVFVLCATNLPWELDMAMLRRLEKRILVPLPNQEARAHMFQSLLSDRCAEGMDWCDLAKRTEGYSGSDVSLVAKEAAMRPLRRLMKQLDVTHTNIVTHAHSTPPHAAGAQQPVSAAGAAAGRQRGGVSTGVQQQPSEAGIAIPQLESVTLEDIQAALQVTKPSARLHEARYKQFSEEYGQAG